MSDRYTIAPDGLSITCKVCGLTSHNPNDIAQKFCGHCGTFHEAPWLDRHSHLRWVRHETYHIARRRQIVIGIAGMVLGAFVLGIIAGLSLERAGLLP